MMLKVMIFYINIKIMQLKICGDKGEPEDLWLASTLDHKPFVHQGKFAPS